MRRKSVRWGGFCIRFVVRVAASRSGMGLYHATRGCSGADNVVAHVCKRFWCCNFIGEAVLPSCGLC